jgi:hypothetical protein
MREIIDNYLRLARNAKERQLSVRPIEQVVAAAE